VVMVLAIHGVLVRARLIGARFLRLRMGPHGAESAATAIRSIVVQRRSPERAPQQRYSQQAHPRPRFSSRSDRNMERRSHEMENQHSATKLTGQVLLFCADANFLP
jgi:hypothetical protein